MSIEKHSRPGWYYVKHYPGGRNNPPERQAVEGYEKAVAVDRALKSKRGEITKSTTYPRLSEVVDSYLQWARDIKKMSPVTMATKERRLNKYIIPVFGKYRVSDLNQTMLDQYANTLPRWSYAADLNHLLAFVTWMIKRDYAKALTWKPERITGSHAVKPVPHPSDMMAAIKSIKRESHRILFSLMLFTGLRWNEARNIRWENVDTTSGTILLKEIEAAQQDLIYIPESLLPWFIANSKTDGYVFTSHKCPGKPVKNLWHVLGLAGQACGMHISTHTFRHASGTYLYEQTNDIYQVQAHLRHTKVTTSQIYTRMSISRKKSAVASVANYVESHA